MQQLNAALFIFYDNSVSNKKITYDKQTSFAQESKA